ncbi:hypothetical protein MKK75_06525, partial [Methylobacterium sp. J-030]|uniref:hypothetical protein n=1 Tax=Methylobacterium sp. J-030 TaxID=2836627 RepID=UPI001FBBE3E2
MNGRFQETMAVFCQPTLVNDGQAGSRYLGTGKAGLARSNLGGAPAGQAAGQAAFRVLPAVALPEARFLAGVEGFVSVLRGCAL